MNYVPKLKVPIRMQEPECESAQKNGHQNVNN